MSYICEPISDGHELDRFTCGSAPLDQWLRHAALDADRAGRCRCYVLVSDAGDVAAFFALSPNEIESVDLPPKIGRGGPRRVPGFLIGKLAVSQERQGIGLGAEVLSVALTLAVEAMVKGGGRFVVVDAIDEKAAAFYEHMGFEKLAGSEPVRLIMKAASAARDLGVLWR